MTMNKKERIESAIHMALKFGSVDGSHHKAWVIDQMLRFLAVDKYDELIAEYGYDVGEWDCGIAP